MSIPNQKIWLENATKEGGIVGRHLTVKSLEDQKTFFAGIPELAYSDPANSSFYKACHSLMDRTTGTLIDTERRMGGLGTYPINFRSSDLRINPRVFNGKYKMGFISFEMMLTMLPPETATKLIEIYNFIRSDAESIMDSNWDESCMVLGHHKWVPPHFHCQTLSRLDECDSISYAVRLTAGKDVTSFKFDFLNDETSLCESPQNTLSRYIFRGKYIHQAYRKDIKDDSLFFFFVWDGCNFKPEFSQDLDLENHVYVTRYNND